MRRLPLALVPVIVEATALLLGTDFLGPLPVGLAWLVLQGWRFWRLDDRSTGWIELVIDTLMGLSLIVLLALNHPSATKVGLSLVYLFWRVGSERVDQLRLRLWRLGLAAFVMLAAIFTATAIWRWPVLVVLVLVWVSSWLVARALLAPGERAGEVLAAAWALVATEISYLFAVWLVSYILPANILIVPQAAIVLVALGYCFMNIYIAHVNAKLSRSRLAEYAIIGLCLLIIVMAGTKWNGAI